MPKVCGDSGWVEPTVMASSALPGSAMDWERPIRFSDAAPSGLSRMDPSFPAETTTTTLWLTSRLTATQAGLWPAANHSASKG